MTEKTIDEVVADLVAHHGIKAVLRCLKKEADKVTRDFDVPKLQRHVHSGIYVSLDRLIRDIERADNFVRSDLANE